MHFPACSRMRGRHRFQAGQPSGRIGCTINISANRGYGPGFCLTLGLGFGYFCPPVLSIDCFTGIPESERGTLWPSPTATLRARRTSLLRHARIHTPRVSFPPWCCTTLPGFNLVVLSLFDLQPLHCQLLHFPRNILQASVLSHTRARRGTCHEPLRMTFPALPLFADHAAVVHDAIVVSPGR